MNEQKMFDFFTGKGFSAAGIYGILGNIKDESGGNPRNLQNSYEKKLGYTDDSYTNAVDSGAYTNFAHDAAGYGLAQWTYSTRKENLLKYARQCGASIGDFEMQLEFMYQELRGYKNLFVILQTTDSIRESRRLMMQSGISQEFQTKCFENFDTRNDPQLMNAKGKAVEYCRSFLDIEHYRLFS